MALDRNPIFRNKAVTQTHFDPVDACAHQIKEAFDRVGGREGRGYMNCLYKAAEICLELKAKPEHYVAAQYAAHMDMNQAFFAGFLITPKARENYQKYMEEEFSESKFNIRLNFQKGLLLQQIKIGRDIATSLMDDFVPYTCWFRVIATKKPLPEVMEKYQELAKKEVPLHFLDLLKKQGYDTNRLL